MRLAKPETRPDAMLGVRQWLRPSFHAEGEAKGEAKVVVVRARAARREDSWTILEGVVWVVWWWVAGLFGGG
jgi:hypothetical protein